MFYVFSLGDTTYVHVVVQLVPNILEHHHVKGHYNIVDAFLQLYQSSWKWTYIYAVLKIRLEVDVTWN